MPFEGHFLTLWAEAALHSLGFFWMAFWAFGLGYSISAAIQVFTSRAAMSRTMGGRGLRPVVLGTFFGFVSSSCSFAALAATRSFLAKGAGLVPSLAFLLASTNLVIELGIVISVFLSWHFVVGEYVGGLILIGVMWGVVRATRPDSLVRQLRDRLEAGGDDDPWPLSALWRAPRVWADLAQAYIGEWQMVWKDVTIGFTVAGIIAAFVPGEFFVWLFPGTGGDSAPGFGEVLAQTIIGPVAAFFTFIGSMGNIPLAGLLYANGVSVAGIMAFIFSDLIVLPVLRVNAQFYGWRMALYIAGVFLIALIVTALAIHYGFWALGLAPEAVTRGLPAPESRFALDYTFWLNLGFAAISLGAFVLAQRAGHGGHDHDHDHGSGTADHVLRALALLSLAWLLAGGVLALWG
ncbi:permease [Primorskyibacter aestuariivivens]|uniref:permease n=1 Tax=Primorskyibacter aestuariivivens TaxID=1888912 RepID=UPI002300752D|nr:permease [Primorskyibacter aestuariivivens]MDA7429841.1 permease [Primorskyibacter aestuariivivens]